MDVEKSQRAEAFEAMLRWNMDSMFNDWVFPEQPSRLVEQLGSCLEEPPEEYRDYPQVNF